MQISNPFAEAWTERTNPNVTGFILFNAYPLVVSPKCFLKLNFWCADCLVLWLSVTLIRCWNMFRGWRNCLIILLSCMAVLPPFLLPLYCPSSDLVVIFRSSNNTDLRSDLKNKLAPYCTSLDLLFKKNIVTLDNQKLSNWVRVNEACPCLNLTCFRMMIREVVVGELALDHLHGTPMVGIFIKDVIHLCYWYRVVEKLFSMVLQSLSLSMRYLQYGKIAQQISSLPKSLPSFILILWHLSSFLLLLGKSYFSICMCKLYFP